MRWLTKFRHYCLTGLLIVVPAWGTVLVLQTLFAAIDGLLAELIGPAGRFDIPGIGLLCLAMLVLLTGVVSTQFVGHWIVDRADRWIKSVPLVNSVYATLQGMADLFQFRSRFDRSTVVVFPFPRDGLWALGFIMGPAPAPVQVVPNRCLMMVFVPTAIHPFTGYLAFVPQHRVIPVNLPPEDAMKMEFSAGLYRPRSGWLRRLPEL
jgi:uncharacterized membrane protein